MPSNAFDRALSSLTEPSYAALRFVSGWLFCFHGLQKILHLFTDHASPPLGSQLWLGGMIELIAGPAIALGGWTRRAAFLASGTMAVAYTQYHWKFRLGTHLLPALNHGELSLVYAWLFLFVACRGAGAFSLDAKFGRAR